ncbi:MAG: hypothetical protein LAP40_12155 [Acidobacteriia bacterium]|nr:hypothetical protein [Terriglobia bacterium]
MRNGIPERDPARRDLTQIWTVKLQQARQGYCRAAAESCRRILENPGTTPADSAATARLQREEARAFAEYCRVLATFTELAADGELPAAEASNVVVMPQKSGGRRSEADRHRGF